MYTYQKVVVTPRFPDSIARLKDLAYNLWWTWNLDVLQVFRAINQEEWEASNRNPIVFLRSVSQKDIDQAASDPHYIQELQKVLRRFDAYTHQKETWFRQNFGSLEPVNIAYLSAEYGLHESLPIYSGGLGVLSGDHCKTASDLGLPFTAVGLLYQHGYFDQFIKEDGWPESVSNPINFSDLPLQPVMDSQGQPAVISIDFPGRILYAKIWRVAVGRISLYLLDTSIQSNSPEDQQILSNLYGGNQETRLRQEIILGIGGLKALDLLNIQPDIIHMNEGHCAFAAFETTKRYMWERGLSFDEAKEAARSSILFTTHTPVPAGTDTFPLPLMDKYFDKMRSDMGISRHEFLENGLSTGWDGNEVFNMTVFGLQMSALKNGVSRIHGMVSRNIFSHLWPAVPEEEIPIGHITNGVHVKSWLAVEYARLIEKHISPDWRFDIHKQELWDQIDKIPSTELWETHNQLKQKCLLYLKKRLYQQKVRHGRSAAELDEAKKMVDPSALTIGFARRFATYKRAALLFSDLDRLIHILNRPGQPVQLVFSGKAHPADHPGQELIKKIQDYSRHPALKGKIFFIENYTMEVARYLVQGVDVWLNNPKKPLEASGTSGQKAGLNGCLNFSILDGWWAEGYNGKNGWAIGDDSYTPDSESQDIVDASHLYDILEYDIIPLYFKRSPNGVPEEWVSRMKESIKSIGSQFSARRMVIDYTDQMYIPVVKHVLKMRQEGLAPIKDLAQFESSLEQQWNEIEVYPDNSPYKPQAALTAGETIEVDCLLQPASFTLPHLLVECYYGKVGPDGLIEDADTVLLQENSPGENGSYRFRGNVEFRDGGEYGYTFRVLPHHPAMLHKHQTGYVKWADYRQ